VLLPRALIDALPPGTVISARQGGFDVVVPGRCHVALRDRLRPVPPWPPQRARTRAGETFARDGATCVVFADDWYRLIAGQGDCEEVITLLLEVPLGLAERRRRRFGYAPPAGWTHRVRHRLIDEWLAPVGEHALITVCPARPVTGGPADAWDRQMHELDLADAESILGPRPIAAQPGFDALGWQLVSRGEGGLVFTELAILVDRSFAYVLRLDEAAPAHAATFAALIASVEPLAT